MTERIVLKNLFNLHIHLRQGDLLAQIIYFTERFFSAAVVMGNIKETIKNARDMRHYESQIYFQSNGGFTPVMGIMLTLETTPEIVEEAYLAGAKFLKNIPAGISTNGCGVNLDEMHKVYPALRKAHELGMVLLLHAEVPVRIVSYKSWIERVNLSIPFLQNLIQDLPGLKVVIEHANTKELIKFVQQAPVNVKGTLTCHHQLLTWKDVVNEKGEIINPLNYCLPLAATEEDRLAVIEAAINDHENFGFGSDSAAHYLIAKNSPAQPAGIFSEPVAIQLLAEIFEKNGRLEELQPFLSPLWAPVFYGFTSITKTVILVKKNWRVAYTYKGIPIFWGRKKISWDIE